MNLALTPYRARLATPIDAPLLPAIEQSAGELFQQIPELAWIADDAVQSVARHLELIALGTAWVVVGANDTPVAFLNAAVIGGNLHIWEMSVHAQHQRNGLGSVLMDAARAYAEANGLPALTLTTFRDVEWNDSFYRRLGFTRIEANAMPGCLAEILRDEAKAGLPAARRCAMMMILPR